MTEELVYKTEKWVTLPEVTNVVKDSLVLNHFPVGLKLTIDPKKKCCDTDVLYLKKYPEQFLVKKLFSDEDFSGQIVAYGSMTGIISKIKIEFNNDALLPSHFLIPIKALLKELTDRFYYNSKLTKENYELLFQIFEKVIFSAKQNPSLFEKIKNIKEEKSLE